MSQSTAPGLAARNPHRMEWWEQLGLTVRGFFPLVGHELQDSRLLTDTLRKYHPVIFTAKSGEELSFTEVTDYLASAYDEARQEETQREVHLQARERAIGWELLNAAEQHPNAGETITRGRWAGFTRGDAVSWCWNLFHFEPTGFVHPNSEVRFRAIAELLDGGIPEVFGYPERARQLVQGGLSAREYREHQERLGSKLFTYADRVLAHRSKQ